MLDSETAWYYLIWNWVGLGGAIVLFILLFATNSLRTNLHTSRWRDSTWLAWLASFSYLVHNVEEYGIDLTGTMYAFPKSMEILLGMMPGGIFFAAVNIPLFWIVGPVAAILSRKYRLMATGMACFMLINALIHVFSSVMSGQYGTGLLTSIVLFIPIALWTFYVNFGKGKLKYSGLIALFGCGIFAHIGLFGTILGLYRTGLVGDNIAAAIQVINAGVLLFLWYAADKMMNRGEVK